MSHPNHLRNIRQIDHAEVLKGEAKWPMAMPPDDSRTYDAITQANMESGNISLRDLDSSVKVLNVLGYKFSL